MVAAVGGRLVLTVEITASASFLITRHLDGLPPAVADFIADLRQRYPASEVVDRVRRLQDLSVLVVGETIIDDYHFCSVMNKAKKDPILAARFNFSEQYPGGVLAIANHVAGFSGRVSLLSALGATDSREDFVRARLDLRVRPRFITKEASPTIVKRRFLEEILAVKLFEAYEINSYSLRGEAEAGFCRQLGALAAAHDVTIVADYGHGLLTARAIATVCERARFLAVNAQTNAENYGFNFVSKHPRADLLAIDESEARLEARRQQAEVPELMLELAQRIDCPRVVVTCGGKGSVTWQRGGGFVTIPALGTRIVDRIGAGDAFLAVAGLAAAGWPLDLVGFVGNLAGAEACATIGNQRPVEPVSVRRGIDAWLA